MFQRNKILIPLLNICANAHLTLDLFSTNRLIAFSFLFSPLLILALGEQNKKLPKKIGQCLPLFKPKIEDCIN